MHSIKNKLIVNTLYNAVGLFWTTAVGIAMIPYMIGHLGAERFGLFIVSTVFLNYLGLLDFGFSASFVKHIAESYAQKDYAQLNDCVNLGLVYYSLYSALAVLISLIFLRFILTFFHMPADFYGDAVFVFIIALLLFSVNNIFSVFPAICNGLQRMDLTNKIGIATSFIWIIGAVIALETNCGIRGLVVVQFFSCIIYTGIITVFACRILPQFRFNPLAVTARSFKKLFFFGLKLQISKFSEVINFQFDKVCVSYFLGLGFVTFYELGAKAIFAVRSVPLLLVYAIVPAVSELNARHDQERLRQIYFRSSKYLAFLNVPLTFFAIFCAFPIVLAWLGPGYDQSARVIQVLALGYFANLSVGVMASMVQGMGVPGYLMRTALLQALLNILLSSVLVFSIGFLGACIGTSIALISGAVYFFVCFHKFIQIPLVGFTKKIYSVPFLSAAAASLAILLLRQSQLFAFDEGNRLMSILALCVSGLIFLVFYIIIVLKTRYFDKADWELFKVFLFLGEKQK